MGPLFAVQCKKCLNYFASDSWDILPMHDCKLSPEFDSILDIAEERFNLAEELQLLCMNCQKRYIGCFLQCSTYFRWNDCRKKYEEIIKNRINKEQ